MVPAGNITKRLSSVNHTTKTIRHHHHGEIALIAQKMRFPMKNFFSKCDQIRRKLRIWSHFTEEILNGKVYFLSSAGGLQNQ